MVIASRNRSSKITNKYFNRIEQVMEVPNLIQIQLNSFEWVELNDLI